MSKLEIRLAGSGGQGVILATVILAEAAILAGKQTAQSQSYGPEARGGSSKAEVIISDDKITFTKVQKPSYLMALTQKALNEHSKDLTEESILVLDEALEVPAGAKYAKVYKLPILRTAVEKVGRAQTANIVAVGLTNKILDIVSYEHIKEAVLARVPKGTEALNEKALEEGIKLAETL